MSYKTFQYRLYPNQKQISLIGKTFGCARFVYNYFLAEKIRIYEETGKSLTFFKCNKQLTALKSKYEWLKEPDKNALQCSLLNLDKAYKNFFRGIKTHKYVGFPKFKKKNHGRQSYSTAITGNNISVTDNGVKLPKLGIVKAVIHRELEGKIKSATVKRTASGKYFVSILCECEIPVLPQNNVRVGIDFGLKTFATLSTGEKIEQPDYKKEEAKIARAQKRLARKKKGSQNRKKAKIKLALAHEKMTNKRFDFQHKLSRRLIDENQVIALETLDIKNMSAKKGYHGRGFARAGINEFIQKLEYKAEWAGRSLVYADRYFPSSQLCHVCGFKNSKVKNLKVRTWKCPKCKTRHDRDVNAAQVLLANAKKIFPDLNTVGITGIYACGDKTPTMMDSSLSQVSSLKQEAPEFIQG